MFSNFSDDKRNVQKPLFAAGNPASAALKTVEIEDNDDECLENLQLSLPPSTLEAILAVQRTLPPSESNEQVEKSVESDETSDHSSTKVSSRKRKQYSSADEDSTSSEKKKKKKHRKRGKDKKHKKDKKHSHKHKHKKRRSRSRTPQRSLPVVPSIPKSAVFLEDVPDLKPEHAFSIDKKANKELWRYKSVSNLHIPKYKAHSFNCLGKSNLSMKDEKSHKNKDDKKKMSRYFGKAAFRQFRMRGTRVASISSKEKEFIRLPKDNCEEKSGQREIGNYSCLDEATALYAQGQGNDYSKPQEVDRDDLVMDEIFQKVAQFNKKTREDPQNIKLWLDFVNFQDTVAQEDKTFGVQKIHLREVYQPTKEVIDKKLSILDKALEANPSSLDLKLTQLELYQDIWDHGKLEKAWEDLLFIHPANVDIWRQYLCRQQSRLSKFSFSHMVKCYHKCFQKLVPILDGEVNVRVRPPDLEEKMIDLFCQYCSFLHESGYSERAVCSYQALIEINLFCPSEHNLSSTKQRMKVLEKFWESSVPRFGEAHAQGWTNWIEEESTEKSNLSGIISHCTDDLEDAIIQEDCSRALKWTKLEKVRENAHWLPWRPDESKDETEDDCEDPDRLVLFDDISPALFKIRKSRSCLQIVCLFLNFLGFTSQKIDTLLDFSSKDILQFVQYSLISLRQTPYLSAYFSDDEDILRKLPDHMLSFIQEVLLQAERYFVSSNRTLFTLLRFDLEVRKCAVSKVADLKKSDKKELKKFGKSLLKETQNRNNLTLWEVYIRLLWATSDKMSETVSMIEVALGMFLGSSSIKDSQKTVGLCNLCKTYAQILLNFEPLEHIRAEGRRSEPTENDKKQAMSCLGALIEDRKFVTATDLDHISSAFILRIRKRFENKSEELRKIFLQNPTSSSADCLVAMVECFALFELCSANLKAANRVYSSLVEQIQSHEKESEFEFCTSVLLRNLYNSQITMMTNVMHISSTPLTEFRTLVNNALQDFPDCPLLQVTFINTESRSHISGRLRKHFDTARKKTSSAITSLCGIASEMLRHQNVVKYQQDKCITQTGIFDSGTLHRLRAIFEQTLQKSCNRHSPLLWKLYLLFEAKYGSSSKVKGILYRGLQNCPWSKSLYIAGISVFEDEELQEMTDLMIEKEIRVRMPLEEVDLLLTAEKETMDKSDESSEVLSKDPLEDQKDFTSEVMDKEIAEDFNIKEEMTD